MDVFALRAQVVGGYSAYVRSFLQIADAHIHDYVAAELDKGRLWPDPLVQLNPSFAPGRSVDELVTGEVLHCECARIFRRDKANLGFDGPPLRFHRHQEDAIEVARSHRSYVLTTGTGSGKSLAYFVPIVDHVLQSGSRRGVKAIVVYPMNALCNSQMGELRKFLVDGYGEGRQPVTFERYTGQESHADRERIATNPPDIVLTNYVMAELLMTRFEFADKKLIEAATGSLEFLVLDELHTYRGRQGADVAMLVRRIRERLGADGMRCVGTSATIAGRGTREERHEEVARVASRLFGTEVLPDHVIGETLATAVDRLPPTPAELREVLAGPATYDASYAQLTTHPLAAWVETAFGVTRDEQGRLERKTPVTLGQAADELSEFTDVPPTRCREHLQAILLAGYRAIDPDNDRRRLFAFRLHQFVSRGDTVYSSIEPADRRHLAMEGQIYVPGSRNRRLFPLAFCRECGQEYFVVKRAGDGTLESRRLSDADPDLGQPGYLFPDPGERWCLEPYEDVLPESWLRIRADGTTDVQSTYKKALPEKAYATPDGRLSGVPAAGALPVWFVPFPFRFCLGCGVTYGRLGEFGKLAELATEGRSTATTIVSLAIVRALHEASEAELPLTARKLLSFTDNRQDASLQSGHLNDFVQVTQLRGALTAAVADAGPDGIGHDVIAQSVTRALGLQFEDYASNPDLGFLERKNVQRALNDVVGYRVYQDLRRGWRVNAPNLEQTGLLRVEYADLAEFCAFEEDWRRPTNAIPGCTGAPNRPHPILANATPEERERACRVLLDFFRRELAIKVSYLDFDEQEKMRQNSYNLLRDPWAIDLDEQMERAMVVRLGPTVRKLRNLERTLGPRGGTGRVIRSRRTWPSSLGANLPMAEFDDLVRPLLGVLVGGGYLEVLAGSEKQSNGPYYQLNASAIRWLAGDGTPPSPDPTRVTRPTKVDPRTNEFFRDLYRIVAGSLRGIVAAEHTAQVPAKLREEREEDFREGTLPILYCSPTMELGVDIADLNAVNMRNVPPTPANYAQRSGRAGRSGQPALVLTYCSSMSPHDQYFFRRQRQMVAGAVAPPRAELANEELIRAHVQAVWLGETGQSLGHSLKDVLDLSRRADGLPLLDSVADSLTRPHVKREARDRCRRLLAALETDLAGTTWFDAGWLDRTVDQAAEKFDDACDRWRHLYLSAWDQRQAQHDIAGDASTSAEARKRAEGLRAEAEQQIALLTDEASDVNTDFYSYRYFASEGFLPGYNFPRLPLAAYIPGRRKGVAKDDFVSRARFLAISEFGPWNSIYYEGSRYRIAKVIMPVADRESGLRTTPGKLCAVCGYGHIGGEATDERCRNCDALLDGSAPFFKNLFRLQNVSTRRVERITSDEEERLRQGYELLTAFAFAPAGDGPDIRPAEFVVTGPEGERTAGHALYAPTATLWRINLGWSRRKDPQITGFLLDMEKGEWAPPSQDADDDPDDGELPSVTPGTARFERVVPFVEDRRNALLLTLTDDFVRGGDDAAGALLGRTREDRERLVRLTSLQYALKRGIEARYQLEDGELAVELLPSADDPRTLLFYEAAEGGAGVLSRLIDEPGALAAVAASALEVCHVDPATGDDLRRAAGAEEDCEAACYDCLLSYTNQRVHRLLDRQSIAPVLLRLTGAVGKAGSGARTREQVRDDLLTRCESELERRFVRFLYDGGYRLPDGAQLYLADVGARPDFWYDGYRTCLYVDGPIHDFPDRQARDALVAARLDANGYTVVRVGGEGTWPAATKDHAWLFGEGHG
jgi:superfamily II DNA/RNA helicase